MAEYIDKEELYQYLDNEVEWNNNKDRLSVMEVVFEFQAADVAPVKHGKWVATEKYMTDECSECGFEINWDDIETIGIGESDVKCCLNCGAIMDLED